ncbi:YppG-like protein [Gracilibacillus ureilyticus]|uniref:YppG-like protein n=1 Tax=Gracilibacillus ureilyticus TaxID=531814 RepID=A0A1H9NPW1_9BACI|nr:YppG family protein [Gracilibacillus ureilyticus]SER37942.1 YppG-like protein [Gracilibacillus ureilyticus]
MQDWRPHSRQPYQYPNMQQPYPQQSVPMTPFQYYQKPNLPLPHYQQNQTMTPPFGKQANSFISYFQTKDGEMDFDKVFQTVNQLASTYQQVSPLFKNVSNIVKSFKA